jgi:hypothetical protein
MEHLKQIVIKTKQQEEEDNNILTKDDWDYTRRTAR